MKRFIEKGKNVWSKKIKKKPSPKMIMNGNMILDKSNEDVKRGVSSTAESSSFGGCKRLFLASSTEKGGCSMGPEVEVGGLISNRPKRVSFNLSSGPISSKSL